MVPDARAALGPFVDLAASEYAWSIRDWRTWRNKFWRCPVTKSFFASLRSLREKEGIGFAVYSVVPVLALSTWPDKKNAMWTRRSKFSITRLAALSGVSAPTARRVIDALVEAGFLREERAVSDWSGRAVFCYRLRCETFYAQPKAQFFALRGHIVYGGWWALLPTHGARAVFLAIAALDPVRDEKALAARMASADGENESWLSKERILELRHSHRYSLAALSRFLGMSRPTVTSCIKTLRARFGVNDRSCRYIRSGRKDTLGRRWFAISTKLNHRLPSSILSRTGLIDAREQVWRTLKE
jgi:DNA-binding MarR family transcriptional regulator